MQQGRWVSYIYKYRNDIRCENAGFIKVQRISNGLDDEARIQIGLKMCKRKLCKCGVYLIYRENRDINECSGLYLTDMHFQAEERDTIVKRIYKSWSDILGNGRAIDDYDGLLFVCDDGEYLSGMWNEYSFAPSETKLACTVDRIPIIEVEKNREPGKAPEETHARTVSSDAKPETIMVTETDAKPETIMVAEIDAKPEHEKTPGEVHTRTESNDAEPEQASRLIEEVETETAKGTGTSIENDQSMQAGDGVQAENVSGVTAENENAGTEPGDVCRSILNTYPRLPMFTDSQFMECVRIVPQDIGKLAMSNWRLGVNSFLSHGYYHYRYLMLGKIKFDKQERYVIGVPGVFNNKEKYLANMFGFSIFVPVKKTKFLMGNFGYWISEVLSE